MSMLVILLPAPLSPGDGSSASPAPPAPWHYVLSTDGLTPTRQGQADTAELPRADQVVAVAPPGSVSWHRPLLPKAPAARLRAALAGLLEEQLLDEDADLALAVAPRAQAGQPTWVAAASRGWLAGQLARLQAGGLTVDRVVPWHAPGAGTPQLHVYRPEAAEDSAPWLSACDADGVVALPLAGGAARALLPRWLEAGARISATPAAATAAERWLGVPVAVLGEAELALAAAAGDWNLLQFDLAPSRRGTRALVQGLRRLRGPAWRPVRWGLAALLLVQVVGLNLWAWHQQRELAGRRAAMDALLRSTHPQVRAVLDAPLQMRRETETLREAAGVPGEGDLEPLLAAAAMAWPEGQPPAAQLRYEPGRLSLAAPGWSGAQIDQLRQRLRPAGWAVESAEGRLTLSRASAAAGGSR